VGSDPFGSVPSASIRFPKQLPSPLPSQLRVPRNPRGARRRNSVRIINSTLTLFRRGDVLPAIPQPPRRVHGRWPSVRSRVTDLEVDVRRQVGIGDADATDHLSLGHHLLLPDVGARE
jgi:hypothetical protein